MEGKRPGPNQKFSKAEISDQMEKCYELALMNYTTWKIAETIGVSQATVVRRLKQARDERITPKVDEYREQQLARIELVRRRLLELMDCNELAVRLKAIAQLNNLEMREARLLGLDAATKIEQTGGVELTVNGIETGAYK